MNYYIHVKNLCAIQMIWHIIKTDSDLTNPRRQNRADKIVQDNSTR